MDSAETVAAFKRLKDESVVHASCRFDEKCGMHVFSYSSPLIYKNDGKIRAVPLPAMEGRRINTASISALSLTNPSPNKKEAWELLEYIFAEKPMPLVLNHTVQNQTSSSDTHWVLDESLFNVLNDELKNASPTSFRMYEKFNDGDFIYKAFVKNTLDVGALFKEDSNIQDILKQYANEIDTKMPHVYPEIVP